MKSSMLHLTAQVIQTLAAVMAFQSGHPIVGAGMLITCAITNWLYCYMKTGIMITTGILTIAFASFVGFRAGRDVGTALLHREAHERFSNFWNIATTPMELGIPLSDMPNLPLDTVSISESANHRNAFTCYFEIRIENKTNVILSGCHDMPQYSGMFTEEEAERLRELFSRLKEK